MRCCAGSKSVMSVSCDLGGGGCTGIAEAALRQLVQFVMPGLVPGIHVLKTAGTKNVNGRDKPGHDEKQEAGNVMSLFAKISSYDERSARLAGIGLMLLSIFMFSFGDALGKYMVATYSVGQLLWLRACAALFVLSPLIWRHRAEFMRLERPWLQLLRVTLSTLEVAAFFLAAVYLPLADVITYYLASPIFVTALFSLTWTRLSKSIYKICTLVSTGFVENPRAAARPSPRKPLPDADFRGARARAL